MLVVGLRCDSTTPCDRNETWKVSLKLSERQTSIFRTSSKFLEIIPHTKKISRTKSTTTTTSRENSLNPTSRFLLYIGIILYIHPYYHTIILSSTTHSRQESTHHDNNNNNIRHRGGYNLHSIHRGDWGVGRFGQKEDVSQFVSFVL